MYGFIHKAKGQRHVSPEKVYSSQGPRLQRVLVALAVSILVGIACLVGALKISLATAQGSALADVPLPFMAAIVGWFSLWLGVEAYWARLPRSVWKDIPALITSVLQWGGTMLVLLVLFQANTLELRLVVVLVLLGIPSRVAVRVLPHLIFRGLGISTPSRVLIVGSGQISQLVAASLLKYDPEGTVLVGFVDDRSRLDGMDRAFGLPTYDVAHLDRLIKALDVNKVVFAFSRLPDSALVKLMRICQDHPDVEVTFVPRFYEAMSPRARLLDSHGLPHLLMPTRHRRFDLMCKAMFDRTLSAIGLLITAPLLLVAAIAIRIEGQGPIFFRQERVGRDGHVFQMFKLRTMRAPLPGEDVDATSRYTGVGAFLRKYSLDELPQLLNVLRGDMSLVGPRPEREEYVKLFSEQIPDYQRRHRVRGGLTGLAQVKGLRGATSIVERTRLDEFYVVNWSFWLDLKIIFLTFKSLIPLSQGIGGDLMFLDLVTQVAQERALESLGDLSDASPKEVIHGSM
jgi:exopolysaccharide biosynthesis polyprenyl glycosylphosphotransferase